MVKKRNKMNYKENKRCVVCGNAHLTEYLDLGYQPLANSYHKGESLEVYPLKMNYCSRCWHSQLSVSVSPSKMFEHYLYVSDTSKTLTDYFKWAKDYILTDFKPNNVLEIACNSGLFLEMFQKDGLKCVGVDPAENLRKLSADRGLDVYVDYWNNEFSEHLLDVKGKFDLILAFHVLPHVEDPNEFIRACKNVLSDNGRIYIQTSQCEFLQNNEFDVIYHEHTSYFTAHSIWQLAHRNGMKVTSIVKTDIHGKSFLFSLESHNYETDRPYDENQLYEIMRREILEGITHPDNYKLFAHYAKQTKTELVKALNKFRERGYKLVGYGAAAKGNTLLNYTQIKLDWIIDDNTMKCGYLTPGMNIPIESIESIRSTWVDFQDYTEISIDKICFIPLAWNFYDEIRERVKKVRDNRKDVFIKYFPEYIEER